MPDSSQSARTMFKISESIRLSKSIDGGILLDVEQGAIFSLNPVGARIVELLREPQTHASLVAQVSQEFCVSEAAVKEDVEEFLASLRRQHLLDDQDNAASSAQGAL
jgi:hypothetical protein